MVPVPHCLEGVTLACFRSDDSFQSCLLTSGDSTELVSEDFIRVSDLLVLRFIMATGTSAKLRPAPALSPPVKVTVESRNGSSLVPMDPADWAVSPDAFTSSGFKPRTNNTP